MDEPLLPIPPDDVRYLAALERWKKYTPPPAAPVQGNLQPDRSAASLHAERILKLYMRRSPPGGFGEEPACPVRVVFVDFACGMLAAMLIPAEMAFLFTFDSHCVGKELRERLVRKEDLKRMLLKRRMH